MAKIKPFRAVIYNQEKVKDLSAVVCPPYDVISPKDQQYYHERSRYNLIHILLGSDIEGEDKYKRGADYFKDWLKNRILIQDDEPCVYFYSQEYNFRGEKRTRLGFISLLKLSEKGLSVFGHEHTTLAPKEDRLRLLKLVKANLSPIFAIFLDKNRIIQRTYQDNVKGKEPLISVVDKEKTLHKIWRIDSPETLSKIQSGIEPEDIFIADGHHRYEVACAFREEMKKKLAGAYTGDEDFNFVLAYFTNTNPRSLLIRPIHRLVKLEERLDLEDFKSRLKDYFDIDEVKDRAHFFFLMEKGGRTEHVIGMYWNKKFCLLRLKNIKARDKLMSDRSKEYRSLDVSILNSLILKRILPEGLEQSSNITFSPDADGLIDKVDKDSSFAAFFLNPVRPEQIIEVALKKEKMPPKSTYFYPKVLSGLVINKFQ